MSKKGMKCTSCGRTAREARLRFQGRDISGWKCSCGEQYFDPAEAQKILHLNRIMKQRYEVTVGQMRSNLIIRIPKELAEALGLEKGGKVMLKADNQKRFHVET
jgi:hypothetical protein